jgi:hypothetical protein
MSGKCELCNNQIEQDDLDNHVVKCISNQKGEVENVLLRVYALHHENLYWLYILIPSRLRLSVLDKYFRDIWLECCGHLSEFDINGKRYKREEMMKPIKSAMPIGSKITYSYDFGSPTYLTIKPVGTYMTDNLTVKLISRNDKPFIKCDGSRCKQDSTLTCTNCEYTYCDKCAWLSKHKCTSEDGYNVEMDTVQIVNSPRSGICGYCKIN